MLLWPLSCNSELRTRWGNYKLIIIKDMADEAAPGGGNGSVGGNGGGDETGRVSASSSPRSRVKFLCSYGGKILPRAADGHLKYVGGDTRVIAIPRDFNFSDLMKKLRAEFEGDMVLKYQVIPEELDVLVSVRTNEDLKHMFDEFDRHESEGNPKLRAFLFPSNPIVIENQSTPMDPHASEQRYVDAVNGMVRTTFNPRLRPINANHPTFTISACSSPKSNSPESITVDSMPHEPTFISSFYNSSHPLGRVHSCPCLYYQQNINLSNHHYYKAHQHYYQHHPHSCQPARSLHDPHRQSPSLPLGRPDTGRLHTGVGTNQYYGRRTFGSGTYNKHGHYDEHFYGFRAADSLPQSPRNRILE